LGRDRAHERQQPWRGGGGSRDGRLLSRAGPVIHLVHGHYGRATGSLALRIVLPLVGVAVGSAFRKGDQFGPSNAEMAGMLIGMSAAAIADATFLGWEPIPEPPSRLSLVGSGQSLALLARW